MAEPVAGIDPAELGGYLASRGWHRDGSWRGAGVWELEHSGQLLIPDHLEYQDDGELITEAVRKLAGYEERPERELVLDILQPMVDSQYFRMHPDAPSGSIPLPAGLRAVQAVHELMRTAARIADEGPRLHFAGRRRSLMVDGLMHRITLGAARPGSYILTARVPVAAPSPPQGSLWPEERAAGAPAELPGRIATSKLHRAVTAAQAAATQVIGSRMAAGQDRLDVFDDSVEQGVCANVCKALGDLGGLDRDRPFEIGFAWGRGLPAEEPADPVAFTGAMAVILRQAGQDLEKLARSGRGQITGEVETLSMRAGEEPRIKVVGDFRADGGDAAKRGLWIIVSRSQYDQAIEAQRAGWQINAAGSLVNAHNRREMRPQKFDIQR